MTNERTFTRLNKKFEELFKDRPNLLHEIQTILREEVLNQKEIIYQYKNFDELFDSICDVTKLSREEITSKYRGVEVVAVRQFLCFKTREIFGSRYSLADISKKVGGRDHATVIYNVRQYSARIKAKDGLMLSILQIWQRYTEIKFAE